MGCGQIDLAIMTIIRSERYVTLYEVKSSPFIGQKQHARLLKSCQFIAHILDAEVQLKVVCN